MCRSTIICKADEGMQCIFFHLLFCVVLYRAVTDFISIKKLTSGTLNSRSFNNPLFHFSEHLKFRML